MTFDEALAHRKRNRIMVSDQDFRHGWNAAILAARAVAMGVNGDAHEAVKAKDATDYVAGYQDAAIDVDEGLRHLEVEVQT